MNKTVYDTGDVIAFADEDLIGKVFRTITKWHINHVGIMINPECMMESVVVQGVICVPVEKFLNRPGEKYLCKLNSDLRKKFDIESFNNFIQSAKGKKYDYLDVTLLGIDRYITPIDFKEDYSRFFCDELVIGALKAAGILDKNAHSAKFTSLDIFDLPIYSEKIKLN